MAQFKVKSPFNFYKIGDIVTEKEVSRFGSQYFEPLVENRMMNASNVITKDNVIEKEAVVTPADTNETPEAETAGNVIAAAEIKTDSDNSANEPNLEEMSYQDLKTLATSKGLEYAHNISKANLIELIKG